MVSFATTQPHHYGRKAAVVHEWASLCTNKAMYLLYLQSRPQARFGLWIVAGNPSSSQVQWLRDLSLGGVGLLLSCSVG